jgi:hypothetical protein
MEVKMLANNTAMIAGEVLIPFIVILFSANSFYGKNKNLKTVLIGEGIFTLIFVLLLPDFIAKIVTLIIGVAVIVGYIIKNGNNNKKTRNN